MLKTWSELVDRKCSLKNFFQNFSKFNGKYLLGSLSLNKVSGLRSTSLLKWDYSTGVFLWILLNFEEHLFWRTSAASARYPLPIHWRSFSSDLSH